MYTLNNAIERIVKDKMDDLNRPDLFREPIFAYSSAVDARYDELKEIIGSWHLSPHELLGDAQSVISYFIPFTRPVTEDPRIAAGAPKLWGETYVVINDHFDHIGEAVSVYLQSQGFTAHSIAGTHTYDPTNLQSMWSHRSAAVIAGLGAFAANRLLITAKGSGGRFCTVLTSVPLAINSEAAVDRCLYHQNGSCGLCFKICPVSALKPGAFDRFSCHDNVLLKNADELSEIGFCDVCGKCISICPYSYIE